jgi:hypothetical protein
MRANRSSYCVDRVEPDAVYIIDLDEGMSVTNNAEAVVLDLFLKYGERRIIYRDTDGRWDELLHDKGHFTGFGPLNL